MSAKRASAPKSLDLGAAKKKTKTARAVKSAKPAAKLAKAKPAAVKAKPAAVKAKPAAKAKPAPQAKPDAKVKLAPAKPAAKADKAKKPTPKTALKKTTPPSKKPTARPVPAVRVAAVKKPAAKIVPPAKKPAMATPPQKPATVTVVPPKKAARTEKEKPMVDTAKPTAPRAVVRIAAGMRTPKAPPSASIENETRSVLRQNGPPSTRRPVGPKIEVNPKLERSKHLVNGSAAPDATPGVKPMSVAAKHRAAAEAVFARVTGADEVAPAAPAAPPPPPSPYPVRQSEVGGPSTYAARINEQDSLVTSLRLSSSPEEALAYASQLAERFKLPPDQTMLLRVIELGDAKLTKLALEELLELEDRGRVRPSNELRSILTAIQSRDPETVEIKQLLLEKIGVSG